MVLRESTRTNQHQEQRQVVRRESIQPNRPQAIDESPPPPPPPRQYQPTAINQSLTPAQFQPLNQPELNSSLSSSSSSEAFHVRNDSDSNDALIIHESEDEEVEEIQETANMAPQKGEIDDLLKTLRDSCTNPPQMDKIDFNFVIKDIATIEKVIKSDPLTDRIFRSKIIFDVFNRKSFDSNSYF